MADIDNLMLTDGSDEFYDERFRNCIEDHLSYLKEPANVNQLTFDNGIAYKYENDFIGLLLYLKIPKERHWLTMRINGYTSPIQYNGDVNFVNIPNDNAIETLRTTWVATYG